MGKFERTVVQVSAEDVIRILESVTATGHIIPYITIAEVMNRVSIAHLSIEKAIKFLIQEAGGKIIAKHHLGNRFRDLMAHNHESPAFLEEAFQAAVRHYGLDVNSKNMSHFKTLEVFLDAAGAVRKFNDIRYWELDPTLEKAALCQVYFLIYMELLYALHEILIEPDRAKETVDARVERAVQMAILPGVDYHYPPGKATEILSSQYPTWLAEYGTFREALAGAVQKNFTIENDFAADNAKAAYKALLEAKDPAVRYFASTLDVLPRQTRDIIPDVKWLDPDEELKGEVSAPSGEILGFIQRSPDGLWCITPIKSGPMTHSTKAKTPTDARCYLAQILTRQARVTVNGNVSALRIVGEERHVFKLVRPASGMLDQDNDETKTYTVAFWDESHGIEQGQEIRIEAQRTESEDPTFSDALSGEVQEVQGHQVSLLGRSFTVVGRA